MRGAILLVTLCAGICYAQDSGLFGDGCLAPDFDYVALTPDPGFYEARYPLGVKVLITCNKGYYLYDAYEGVYVKGNRIYVICGLGGKFNLRISFQCIDTPPPSPCSRPEGMGLIVTPSEDEYYPGEEIAFSCEKRYKLSGNRDAYCESSGQWSDTVPTCKPRCPLPEQNELIIKPHKDYYNPGEKITLECAPGYKLDGARRRICEKSGEFYPKVTPDLCVEIGCPAPPFIAYGGYKPVLPKGKRYDQDSTITYYCDINYKLVGKYQRICTRRGIFVYDAPKCVEIRCDTPMGIDNGFFEPEKEKYSVDEFVTYQCETTYKLNTASGERSCKLNDDKMTAEFEEKPECVPIFCDRPKDIANGKFKIKKPKYRPGEEVEYECDDNYYLVGSEIVECVMTSSTTAEFEEAPVCKPVRCDRPMDLDYGSFEKDKDSYGIGETVSYECDYGFTREGPAKATCKRVSRTEGKFTDAPVCKPMCFRPMDIDNGSFEEDKVLYLIGETVTYKCDETFYLGEPKTATCEQVSPAKAVFSKAPVCIEILCNKPMSIDNGGFDPDDVAKFKIGQIVSYFCAKGFKFGTSTTTAICEQTGAMTAEFTESAVCIPIKCKRPMEIENGYFEPDEDMYFIDQYVTYTCDYGFELSRKPGTSFCRLDRGDQTATFDAPPKCTRIYCDNPGAPEYGDIDEDKPRYTVGETVTFSCGDCYDLDGSDTATCLPSGYFSTPVPKCILKTCNWYPEIPQSGRIDPLDKKFKCGQKVYFICYPGYVRVGPEFTTCLGDDKFSVDSPTCKPISCDPPKLNRYVSARPRQRSYPYKKDIRYMCRWGYTLVGATSATCQIDGTWSEPSPDCKPNTCGAPPTPKYGGIDGEIKDEYAVGKEVNYVCDEYYTLVGMEYNECGKDGKWKYDVPTCEAPSCNGNCYAGFIDGRPCQCDSACCSRGDCCGDFKKYCGKYSCCLGTKDGRRCGSSPKGMCRCDSRCSEGVRGSKLGCCKDYLNYCPGTWYE